MLATYIKKESIKKVIELLSIADINNKILIEKGVKQVARLWQISDGKDEEFIQFCKEHYCTNSKQKEKIFIKISEYLEAINGHFNEMSLHLQRHIHENTGALQNIDELFAAYSPDAHISDDFYKNKIAFIIALNFPELTLEEKEKLGNDRLSWAYARLGDVFTSRIPAVVQQAYATANSEADVYVSGYNIHAGQLLKNGKYLFPKDVVLLSHWGLRDEIKANYNQGKEGLEKQQTIYEVIKRIISQEIPIEVIYSDNYQWDPFSNTIYQNGKKAKGNPEKIIRYKKLIRNFKALKTIDKYTGNTYLHRHFSEDMEYSLNDTEAIFRQYLASPELQTIGQIITKRLNRDLEPFDIWYDGFKIRRDFNENELSKKTQCLYPNAMAFERQLHIVLQKLGFTAQQANFLSKKITVNAARGSGHAWGVSMKNQKSHLRTPISSNGMNYKGFNTAIHELGHNVEQTFSFYNMDHYLLTGVPNTAFTEALAFIFQKRDIQLLDITDNSPQNEILNIFDKAWSLFEITGVSLLDISIWKWLYENPLATPLQLKNQTLLIAQNIWNEFFQPVFKIKNETILAIYSHMISYPLYLCAYAYGQIIEFQLEQHLKGKNFAHEIERIFSIGRLTPNQWLMQAIGNSVSLSPLLNALREALTVYNRLN